MSYSLTTKLISLASVSVLALSMTAYAQTAKPQAPQPLPDGHPQMPAGHPQVPADKPQLPTGHPQVPADKPQLPTGHPAVPGAGKSVTAGPFTASIAIKATQKTKDAQAPSGDTVRVKFYVQNKVVKTVEGKLDEHGVLILEDIALDGPARALVTLTHANVPYNTMTRLMSADQPDQMVRLNVFETTTQNPGWQMNMRHVMIRRVAQGLVVNEMLAITTPGDRTWLGSPLSELISNAPADARATLVIPISQTASEIVPGHGLQSKKVKVDGHRVIGSLPLSPGTLQVQINYLIPVKDGKAQIQIIVPTGIKQLMVFAPDDGSTITSQGLKTGGAMKAGKRSVRMFSASNVPAGQQITLDFANLPDAAMSNAASVDAGGGDECCDKPGPMHEDCDMDHAKDTNVAKAQPHEHAEHSEHVQKTAAKPDHTAKIVAGIGVGILGLAVAMVFVIKPSKAGKSDSNTKG